jgi:uracil-DNA glycosylase
MDMVKTTLPEDWQELLADELEKPYFQQLYDFVLEERQKHTVFPPAKEVFSALRLTPYANVKVMLLGQDPYHDHNQAHGLCFSVRPGVTPPPSLLNIFKELRDDLGCSIPNNGYLVPWAEQGVLLLNAVLTVEAHKPASHANKGWETFTDAIIRKVSDKSDPVVFVLWGNYARKKSALIDKSRHIIIESAHPSPLSAKRFMGSRPFSKINDALRGFGKEEINWQVPNL